MTRYSQVSKKQKGQKVRRKIVQAVKTKVKKKQRRRRLRENKITKWKNSKLINRAKKNQKYKNSVSSHCAEKSSKAW